MQTNVEALLFKIDATTEKLRKEVERAERTVASSSKRMDSHLSKLDSRFNKLSQTVGRTVKAMAVLALARIGTGFVNSIRDAEMQMARLEVATGSVDAAKDAFDELIKFAAKTPFALSETVDAFVRLKNLGLDPSIRSLRSYGNTASAMGKDINQMIEAVADAATGEFERLKDFGIKAKSQGDQVSFIFRNVTTTVKKNAMEIEDYLRNIGETDFASGMDRTSQTLTGQLSNLGDSLSRLAVQIGELGILEGITNIVRTMGDWVEKIIEVNNELVKMEHTLYVAITGPIAKLNKLYERRIELETEEQKIIKENGGLGLRAQAIGDELMLLEDQINKYEEMIKNYDKLKDKILDKAGADKKSAEAAAKAAAIAKAQADALKKLNGELDKLQAKYDESFAEIREYQQVQADLKRLYDNNRISLEAYTDALNDHLNAVAGMDKEVEEIKKTTTEITKQTSAISAAFERAAERLSDIFADMWKDVIKGTQSSFDAIKDMFKNLLAELAHAAITRPIMLQIGAALGLGGAAGTATAAGGAAAAGGFGGMLSNLTSLTMGNSIGTFAQGVGDWMFANTALPTGNLMQAGMIPNWQFGLAGLIGGFAGDKLFGGYGGLGGSLGAAAGLAFGGPVGAVVGGAAGGFLGGLFGKKNKNQPQVGIMSLAAGADTGPLEDQYGVSTPFGIVGLSGRSKDVSPKREQEWQQFIASIAGIDEALGAIMSEAQIARASQSVAGFEGNFSDLNDLTGEKLAANVNERMALIVREMTGTAGDALKIFSEFFTGTVEELIGVVNAVSMLQQQIDTDVWASYQEGVELANRSLTEQYYAQVAAVRDLAGSMDMTAESMLEVANANTARIGLEIKLLAQLDAAAASIQGTLGNTIESITMNLLDQAGKYERVKNQADDLAASLETMTDPAKIAETVAAIDRLTNQAYGLLDEDQQQTMGQSFINFLTDVETLSTQKIDAARDAVIQESTEMRDVIETAMQRAADQFKSAAIAMQEAAATMQNAANTPVRVAVTVSDAGEVNG